MNAITRACTAGLLGLLLSFSVSADDNEWGSSNLKLEVDTTMYGGDPGKVKKAIFLSFLNRGWIVDEVSTSRFVGHFAERENTKAQFILNGNKVTITTVKGADEPRESWLGNLRKDFLVYLVQQVDYK
ncbi:MAG: hypothetical protein OEZ68_20295 [Gammaproteobacteria bacterium]|nr:hypothetical protein [Gammaproteobacteria bacterium]MDH5803145.1 hypothetical protein [Gammaproteobacteria bacterium]